MRRTAIRTGFFLALFIMTACSQTAAPVDMRGQNSYGRSSTISNDGNRDNRSYAMYRAPKVKSSYQAYEPPPVYLNTKQETSQTAAVQSIGVSDLPPPASTAAPAPDAKPQSVNHWTNKPRSEVQEESRVEEPGRKSERFASRKASSYMWPVNSHKVISGFGPKGSGKTNDGINIASAEGEPVWASADGEVIYAGNELAGYGNMVVIKHTSNKNTSYAHLSRATVDKYDRVKQGDIIGYVGATGNVKKPQLHFAVRDGKTPVDPKKYLSASMAGL